MPIRTLRNDVYKDLMILALEEKENQSFFIENWPEDIQYISNPSKKIQMLAVSIDSTSILYIKNACEEAQLKAIEDLDLTTSVGTYYLINAIKNIKPSVLMQLYNSLSKEQKKIISKHPNYKSLATQILDKIQN